MHINRCVAWSPAYVNRIYIHAHTWNATTQWNAQYATIASEYTSTSPCMPECPIIPHVSHPPGQAPVLQSSLCESAGHAVPPCAAAVFTERFLVFRPPPHVKLQLPQLPQLPRAQLTAQQHMRASLVGQLMPQLETAYDQSCYGHNTRRGDAIHSQFVGCLPLPETFDVFVLGMYHIGEDF